MASASRSIQVEDLTSVKGDVLGIVSELKGCHAGLSYADVRVRVDEGPVGVSENGVLSAAVPTGSNYDCCYGVRVIAGAGSKASAYSGGRISARDFHSGRAIDVVRAAVLDAYKVAMANGEQKDSFRGRSQFGESVVDMGLADIPIARDVVILPDSTHDPRSINHKTLADRAVAVSAAMLKVSDRMTGSQVQITPLRNRQIYFDTDGSDVDSTYDKTQAFLMAVARTPEGGRELFYDALGGMHGLEVLDGRNNRLQSLEVFANEMADETSRVSMAPVLEGIFPNVRVVTDPDFNSLLVHEIVGHPVEADRCLGMETGYAGRSHFFRSGLINMVGQRVASPLLSVSSRTDLDSYGRLEFDDEGVRGKRVVHIENGVLRGFLHSRWSAHVMQLMGIPGQFPNGAMRATNACDVPYIRMTQTGIDSGISDPNEMLERIGDGFYLAGKRIPSISESRENFRISARRTHEVKGGKLCRMFRGGCLTADSIPFMMGIWAVGNDGRPHIIFNCGKALPQQVMYLCNQAPSIGSVGTVMGGLGDVGGEM